jgi:hypothetical protein
MRGTIVPGASARSPGRRAQVVAPAAHSLSDHSPVVCAPCWVTLGGACVSVSGVLLVAHLLACPEQTNLNPAGLSYW